MDDELLAGQLARLAKFGVRGVLAIGTTIDRRLSWRGLVGGGEGPKWTELVGEAKPMIGGRFTLAIEYDDAIDGAKVSYLVNGERLEAGGEGWLAAPNSGNANGEVMLVGLEASSAITGETTDPNLVEAGGEKYRSLEAALAKNDSLTPLTGIRWDDAEGRYLVYRNGKLTVRQGSAANGLPSYVSYVLGLYADDPTSLPLVTIRPAKAADRFVLGLGNAAVNAASGVRPTFSLISSPSPGGPYAVESSNETGEFEVGSSGDGSKFFKVRVDLP